MSSPPSSYNKLKERDAGESDNSLSFDELHLLKYSQDQLPRRSGLNLLITTITSIWCSILFGYNTGVISPALLTIEKEISMSSIEKSVLVSSILISAMLGSALTASVIGTLSFDVTI
jgi:hypothetical protein